jgi:hypothetical protein
MSSIVTALIVFGCAFGMALLGLLLHQRLPRHHLDEDSKEVVKLVMGLIATMAALVLSLLIASANSSYNQQSSELESMSANVVLLDRLLMLYGPETKPVRTELRAAVQMTHDQVWLPEQNQSGSLNPGALKGSAAAFIEQLEDLTPRTEAQRGMQNRALQLSETIGQTRLLMFAQRSGGSVSWPFLTVLVFWICVLFLGFGLFTRANATVVIALLVGTLSVSGAVFLILELNTPYRGLMKISDAPLRAAMQQIGS